MKNKGKKIIDIFIDLFKGFLIGLDVTVPGFSIGTLAIILNIYDRLIDDISAITKHPLKIIIKDLYLGLGFIIGFILDIVLISYFLTNFPLQTVCFFVGLVIITIPKTLKMGINASKEDKKEKKNNYIKEIIACIIAMGVMITVTLLNAGTNHEPSFSPWFLLPLFGCGMIASGTMIIPGISGSLLVLALGYYDSIIMLLKGFGKCIIDWNFTNFTLYLVNIVVFIFGAIVGVILMSKLIKMLKEKFESIVYFSILGLLIVSPFAIIYLTAKTYVIDWNNIFVYIVSIITIALGILFGIFVNKLESNVEKEQVNHDENKTE